MKFRKMFLGDEKAEASNYNTSQNVQQNSTNTVNFIGDVRRCELFSVGFINKCLETFNIDGLVSTLRRRRGIFFLNSEISYQNSIL
jgi:hypothetical protein